MNSNHLFKRQLSNIPLSAAVGLFIVALIGFIDAGYLTVEHYQNVIPPCSITGGCEVVLTSDYSVIFGVPVSLLGMIYYFLIMAGTFGYLESKHVALLKWSCIATTAGFLMSLWFLYVQAFILNKYCLYCLGSATTSIILFVIGSIVLKKYGHINNVPESFNS